MTKPQKKKTTKPQAAEIAAEIASETPVAAAPIVAFKGFDVNFACRDYQYEVGRTERHAGKVAACKSGFHACEHPLDVFKYYPPATSRYAIVEMAGEIARDGDDTKIASAEITIKAEIKLPELIASAIRYVTDRVTWITGPLATGEKEGARSDDAGGAATASGWQGAATASGYDGKARGADGNALFLVERGDDGAIVNVWAGIAGKDGIKPMTWYHLRGGKPVEVE